MKCLRTFRGAAAGPMLGAAVVFAALGLPAETGVPQSQGARPDRPLVQHEQSLRRVPAHTSEFVPVRKSPARPGCGVVRPPEALVTPDPVIEEPSGNLHVHVSFIVGSDGRVHSAFIVSGGSPVENRAILRAVRHWRYRPGLCNGVPTDVEAQVLFAPR